MSQLPCRHKTAGAALPPFVPSRGKSAYTLGPWARYRVASRLVAVEHTSARIDTAPFARRGVRCSSPTSSRRFVYHRPGDPAPPVNRTGASAPACRAVPVTPDRACTCVRGLPRDRARSRRAALYLRDACCGRTSPRDCRRPSASGPHRGSPAFRSRPARRAPKAAVKGDSPSDLPLRASSSTLSCERR